MIDICASISIKRAIAAAITLALTGLFVLNWSISSLPVKVALINGGKMTQSLRKKKGLVK